MNKKRRTLLASAKAMLERAANIIEQASEQENDCMDNLPESLQDSERYEKMEQAVANLDDALEHVRDAVELVEEASI